MTPGKASASRREVFLNRLTLLDLCVDVRLHQAVKRLGLCRLDGLGDLLRQLHLRLGKRRRTSGSAVGMVSCTPHGWNDSGGQTITDEEAHGKGSREAAGSCHPVGPGGLCRGRRGCVRHEGPLLIGNDSQQSILQIGVIELVGSHCSECGGRDRGRAKEGGLRNSFMRTATVEKSE